MYVSSVACNSVLVVQSYAHFSSRPLGNAYLCVLPLLLFICSINYQVKVQCNYSCRNNDRIHLRDVVR